MNKSMKITNLLKGIGLIIIMICLSPNISEAQFLKDVARSAKNKLARKIENKVVETLAEEIARRAFRPINDVMDDWIRENMKRDSTYAGLSDDSLAIIMQDNYGTILNSMNKAADVPDNYSFDYSMDITVTDDKDVHEMKMFLSEKSGVIGIEQYDGKEKQMMVMDIDKDIIVIYTLDKKEAQALPGMMSFGAAFANSAVPEHKEFKVTKKGGSKNIAGYSATEFEVVNEDFISNIWVSNKVPFDWSDSYGKLVERFSPKSFQNAQDQFGNGMMLESTTKEFGKKKGKYKSESHWLTTNISEKEMTIDNKAYSFGYDTE